MRTYSPPHLTILCQILTEYKDISFIWWNCFKLYCGSILPILCSKWMTQKQQWQLGKAWIFCS